MASRSVDLGGLPPVGQPGGFDVDHIIKIAALMQNQHEMEMKYGTTSTPGTPPVIQKGTSEVPYQEGVPASGGIVTAKKPWYQGVPVVGGLAKLLGAPTATPITRLDQVPADAQVDPATLNLLQGGGTAYVRGAAPATPTVPYQAGTPDTVVSPGTPGTPGTMGLEQLKLRTAIAEQVTPDDRATLLTDASPDAYKKVKFIKGAPKTEVFYNAYTGRIADATQLETIKTSDPASAQDYYKMDQTEAIKQAGDFWRAKIRENGSNVGDLLRLFSDEVRLKPWERTESDKAMINALKSVVVEKLGVKTAVDVEKSARANFKAEYTSDKAKALQAIQAINALPITDADKQLKRKTVIDRLKSTHSVEDGFYDLTNKEEKSLISGD